MPFILNDAGYPIYPTNSRVLSFAVGDKITIFCHGTEKRSNRVKSSSLGLNLDNNNAKLELECRGTDFYHQDQMVTTLNEATCIRQRILFLTLSTFEISWF